MKLGLKKTHLHQVIIHLSNCLPYVDPFTLLFVNVDKIQPEEFFLLLQSSGAKWIVDTRINPRLDLVAGTRNYAFKLFEMNKAEYIDLSNQAGLTAYYSINANPEVWGEFVGNAILNSKKLSGPFIILFDNAEFMKDSQTVLPRTLKHVLGRTVSLAVHS